MNPGNSQKVHVVDNRMFVIALDGAYRDRMKHVEQAVLLSCAQRVADTLGVAPDTGPVEGYYTETPELAQFFQIVRALRRERIFLFRSQRA